jgi:hypothetical protein
MVMASTYAGAHVRDETERRLQVVRGGARASSFALGGPELIGVDTRLDGFDAHFEIWSRS